MNPITLLFAQVMMICPPGTVSHHLPVSGLVPAEDETLGDADGLARSEPVGELTGFEVGDADLLGVWVGEAACDGCVAGGTVGLAWGCAVVGAGEVFGTGGVADERLGDAEVVGDAAAALEDAAAGVACWVSFSLTCCSVFTCG
jgi:hypothetical protein